VTTLPRDPLHGTDRLLIDGTNLLHALSRRPGQLPQAALIGRLRGTVPANIGIELIFDGSPDRGLRGERVASGLIVRHGGRRSADELLISLVDETRAAAGIAATSALLVVSDDHGLRAELRSRGARTAGSAWLLGRLDRHAVVAPSVGNKRRATPTVTTGDGEVEKTPWKTGRGATTKKGNPRRGHPPSGRMPA
jgi:hypothetical protein